jgi:RNA polymerase sigma-70 factor (ECF subfamily)
MQPDESDLVERSKGRDLSAFNQIVERYQSHVFNLAARILGDRAAAEDVAQETFISAFLAIDGFRGGSLRGWLLRIASNRSYDSIRSTKRRSENSLDESLEHPSFQPASKDPSPEQMALRGELRDEIQNAVLSLPPDQRAVVVMIDVQGLSYDEASEATGASLGTVKSRLSRARAAVRGHLLDRSELLPDQFRQ